MRRCGRVLIAAAASLWLAVGFALPPSAGAVARPKIFAPPDQIVGEADGHIDLTVRLSAPGDSTVTVHYATAELSADDNSSCSEDYIGADGTLTFAPGETTKVVPVDVCDDSSDEALESFTFDLDTPTNATIARAGSEVGIADNDPVVTTPRLFIRDATVDEKDGTALVPVLLGGPGGQRSNSTVTVHYASADDSATAGSDYTATGDGILTFLPGESAKTIAVPIADDARKEPAERFSLALSGATNAGLGDATGVVTIGASDGTPVDRPAISAPTDQIVGEADGYVDLAVRLSAPGTNTVRVRYATHELSADDNSTCSEDYIGAGGSLTFAPGETTKVVRIDICDDSSDEDLESFTFNIREPINSTIARTGGEVAIADNDPVVTTPKLFIRDATIDEKDGTALVPVLLGGPGGQRSNSNVTVHYANVDDTATAGSDYRATAGTLTFAPGESAKTIAVPIVNDALHEPAERFSLRLTSPTNASFGDANGVVTIGASDATAVAQPKIATPLDLTVGESSGYIDVAVRLSAPGTNTVRVRYATAELSADDNSTCSEDYIGADGTLTFAPGETTKVVRIDICDDSSDEALESFTFDLDTPTNATIGRPSTEVSITDNDP